MRLRLLILLPALAVIVGGAGGARRRQAVMPTPQATLQDLKNAVARRDRAAEWATLSPGLKLRISREAGRTVDVGDYTTFRNSKSLDPQIRQAEGALRGARIKGIRYYGGGHAWVGIRFGGPLFMGKTIGVRMVNHQYWELRVKGESQPYWGFEGDRSIEANKSKKDGSWTVIQRDLKGKITWQQTWAWKDVVSYREKTRWYFNDFGAFEKEFFGGVGQ